MCRPGCLSNTVCTDIAEDPDPRPSHFPCWLCIRTEARTDAEAAARAEQDALAKAQEVRERVAEARERAFKEKHAAESKVKEERIRREARERAAREREEELKLKREKEEEERRARMEGGLWIETGGGRKGKGKKSGANSGTSMPITCSAAMVAAGREKKENESGKVSPKKEIGMERTSPKKDKKGQTGRAGVWGPKKILSRKGEWR